MFKLDQVYENTQHSTYFFDYTPKNYGCDGYKKTRYVKHLSVVCNINKNKNITFNFCSDIATMHMNQMEFSMCGVDPDFITGGFINEKQLLKLVKLDDLSESYSM